MPKVTDNPTPPRALSRRALSLAGGAAALGAAGLASNPEPAAAALQPSPITVAARRLAVLSKTNEDFLHQERDAEADEVRGKVVEIAESLREARPQTMADAAILLMSAAAEINANDFYNDGTEGCEHGEVIVLRVMHFLAETAGIDLRVYGGAYLLSPDDQEAFTVDVAADAARRLHRIDEAEADRRRAEYNAALEVQIARARKNFAHAGAL